MNMNSICWELQKDGPRDLGGFLGICILDFFNLSKKTDWWIVGHGGLEPPCVFGCFHRKTSFGFNVSFDWFFWSLRLGV